MLKQLPGAALGLLLLLGASALRAAPADAPGDLRVPALYTTWDDYYLYVGAVVHDTHVNATNTTPTSQPQEDDDVEVFLETNDKRADVRTPQTYQMAVSAANGAYFSVGNGTAIPKAKAIYTYKYAATVDGSLNDNSDTDAGFTVEIAIPWQELGRSGPPRSGETWGFNVISRDRQSTGIPASRFYSLSPNVRSAADVQDPSKWSQIVFDSGSLTQADSTTTRVISSHIPLDRYPDINGSIVSGEWPSVSRVAFGEAAVEAPAPTVAQEPNTTDSPFGNVPPEQPVQVQAPPPPAPAPVAPPEQVATAGTGEIELPGGGSIKIVPGGIHPPPMVPQQEAAVPADSSLGAHLNPLTPRNPKGYKVTAPNVSLVGSLQLGANKPAPLVMAIYRIDYNADGRKGPEQNVWNAAGGSLLVDQPINGAGPWFSGLHPFWHQQQLSDLRRAGIDIALIRARSDDPLLGHELDALVEALKQMAAHGQDYPLIGVDVSTPDAPLATIYQHVPSEFRAIVGDASGQNPGLVVYAGTSRAPASLPDGTPLTLITDNAAVVSPGRVDPTGIIGRDAGQTYAESWRKATDAAPQFVVVDSWNDFSHGTEVCATRQYGERYADDTRLYSNAFNGSREWHAKYLAEYVPRTILPKTLYQIPIRIENAGTLPWRAREEYALCARWYKDGRLYDDSAPRVPVGDDILPGQSITMSVGLAARNGYGDDLEPGQYTLVFDMVQGEDRWFSYANDTPLQVPVTVTAAGATVGPQATFIGSDAAATCATGATYLADVSVRNDGSADWQDNRLAYKIQTVDPDSSDISLVSDSPGVALAALPVSPGQVATVSVPFALKGHDGHPLPVGDYRLHWYILPGKNGDAVAGAYDESLSVVSSHPGASFVLSDSPRQADAGKDATAQLAVQNGGPTTWQKGSMAIGYHWYYLDGREAQWEGADLTPLPAALAPEGVAGDVTAKFRAPDRPGRYALVWDVRSANGTWSSTAPAVSGIDMLETLVTVSGKGGISTLDLSKYATVNGISGPDKAGDFDGQGHAFPVETLPPDGTSEVEGNPLLQGKPGPPLYPSGYYAAQTGSSFDGNHDVPFLYPIPREGVPNVVVCRGQTIKFSGDEYKEIHVLAAATGGEAAQAAFGLQSGSQTATQTLSISDWSQTPSSGSIAFHSPYRIGKDGDEPVQCSLGDYVLLPTAGGKTSALVLPDAPDIKILAITLVK